MKKFDDIVIIRRSHSDTRSGKHGEVFAVTYLGNNDIGTECYTRAEADAQAQGTCSEKEGGGLVRARPWRRWRAGRKSPDIRLIHYRGSIRHSRVSRLSFVFRYGRGGIAGAGG